MSKNQSVSRFAGILAAKHDEHDHELETKPKARRSEVKTYVETNQTAAAPTNDIATSTAARRGRPRAKRSDPEFVQTSPYIRKTTLLAVKSKLLHEGEKREYSELVEELLTKWLSI